MPMKAPAPCATPGCAGLATRGRYCPRCAAGAIPKRPSPSAMGYDWNWTKLRRMVLSASPMCADPDGVHDGMPPLATEVDHIRPLRDGGTNDLSNLQALCKSCHSRKTMREMTARAGAAGGLPWGRRR